MDNLIASLSRQSMTIAQQNNPQQKENWLADILLNGPATVQTQAAILKQMNESAASQPNVPAGANRPFAPSDTQRRYRSELPDSSQPMPMPTDPQASTIAACYLARPTSSESNSLNSRATLTF